MITNHSTATVLSGIKWVLFSLMAWQLIALLRSTEWFSTTTHTVGVLEILLFTAIPALVAYAFIRLFLAVVQLDTGPSTPTRSPEVRGRWFSGWPWPVSYTHLRAHETKANLVCRLLLEKKKK